MHMKVAGKQAEVEPLPNGMAQIYIDGKPFSFPVTRSEAGIPYEAEEIVSMLLGDQAEYTKGEKDG